MTRNQRLMARGMGVIVLGSVALLTPNRAVAHSASAVTPCQICEEGYYCDQTIDLENACQFYCDGRHYRGGNGSCTEFSDECGGTATAIVCF